MTNTGKLACVRSLRCQAYCIHTVKLSTLFEHHTFLHAVTSKNIKHYYYVLDANKETTFSVKDVLNIELQKKMKHLFVEKKLYANQSSIAH